MKKILFDADFKNDKIGQQLNFRLFEAFKKISDEYTFEGFSQTLSGEKTPQNVNICEVNFFGIDNLWRASIPAIFAFTNKNIPFYFPCGNIPGLMPSNTPIILLIRDVLPLDAIKDEERLKKFKRRMQSDISRSDLVFVLNDNVKDRLTQEFLFLNEPVVLGFASLIPEDYIDLPLARSNEKYFFVDVENVSPTGLSDLLKIFIYSQMKNRKATKLYLSGNFGLMTEELAVNLQIARKVGAIREYKNLTSEQRSMLLRGAIAAILPSKVDILPFAQLDAMKCSCPVVTDMQPSISEVCADSVIYADINKAESFRMLLNRLEFDEEYRREYIYKGLYREKIFSWSIAAKNFIKGLEKLFVEE